MLSEYTSSTLLIIPFGYEFVNFCTYFDRWAFHTTYRIDWDSVLCQYYKDSRFMCIRHRTPLPTAILSWAPNSFSTC